MRRRLPNLLTALSMLPSVAVGFLRVRSHRYADALAWPWSATRHAQLYSARGSLTYFDLRTSIPGEWRSGWTSMYMEPKDRSARLAGSGFAGFRSYSSLKIRFWRAPYWFAGSVAALWPAWRLIRAGRARRRLASQLCPTCGYDLRATPDRCPECGNKVVP